MTTTDRFNHEPRRPNKADLPQTSAHELACGAKDFEPLGKRALVLGARGKTNADDLQLDPSVSQAYEETSDVRRGEKAAGDMECSEVSALGKKRESGGDGEFDASRVGGKEVGVVVLGLKSWSDVTRMR